MGRWFLLIIVVVIAISPGMVFLYVSRERPVSPQLEVRREASYQSALQAYSKELRPGLTRKDVAEYLGKKGIHFGKHLLLGAARCICRLSRNWARRAPLVLQRKHGVCRV